MKRTRNIIGITIITVLMAVAVGAPSCDRSHNFVPHAPHESQTQQSTHNTDGHVRAGQPCNINTDTGMRDGLQCDGAASSGKGYPAWTRP